MIRVREAAPSELAAVRNVLDGAMLESGVSDLERTIAGGAVLVAVHDTTRKETATVLGALVLDGEKIVAVAVRTRRRNQGIGTALVEAAAGRRVRLVAEFREAVRPFWESVGFDIRYESKGGRYRGVFTE